MSKNRFWTKTMLFFSSYTLLFLALFVKNQFLDDYKLKTLISIILVLIITVPNIIFVIIIWHLRAKNNNPRSFRIERKKEINHLYLQHLLTYIVPIIAFNNTNYSGLIITVIFLIAIYAISMKTTLLYINILFLIVGYNLFLIEDSEKDEYYVLSKKLNLQRGTIIKCERIGDLNETLYIEELNEHAFK